MTLQFALLCISAGLVAGFFSGVLGIGGGIIVVPALLMIFTHEQLLTSQLAMHAAVGSSMAIMIFTSQASVWAHYQLQGVLWSIYKLIAPGIIIGTISGAILSNYIPTNWLKRLLAIFLIFIVVKIFFGKQKNHHDLPKSWVTHLVSLLIGLNSGLLGLGGGVLIIPYLSYCGVAIRKITAVSALCTLTVSIIGTLTFIITGLHQVNLPFFIGYVYWPAVLAVAIPSSLMAPLAARLTYKLPLGILKYSLVIILLVTIINLLINQ